MKLTKSQEKSLNFAYDYLQSSKFYDDDYRFREFKIKESVSGITVSALIDNGHPGTIGYVFPVHFIFHIGKRGCIYILEETKRKNAKQAYRKITGKKALIYSQVS